MSQANSSRNVSESSQQMSLSNSTGSVQVAEPSTTVNATSTTTTAPAAAATTAATATTENKLLPASSPELLEEEKITKILNSDVAIEALLSRLKKSIFTCEEFSKFVRKKAVLEEDHNEHLKKISRATQETFKTSTNLKNDSFLNNLERIVRADERIAQNGANFSKSLHQMHEELNSLSSTIAKSRKNIKENFKRKEKEVVDSISNADKAKNKYDNFCTELERLKTTDPTKKTFTLKGSKTTSEQEETLKGKIEVADSDYRQKVATSTGLRSIFLDTFRPTTARNLKDLILEIDVAMSVQLQKYTSKIEERTLQDGVTISPISGKDSQSLKVIASSVNNERDLYQYLIKYANSQPSKGLIPVQYRQHPSMITIGSAYKGNKFTPPTTGARNISNNSDTVFGSSTGGISSLGASAGSGATAVTGMALSNGSFKPAVNKQDSNRSGAASPYLDSTNTSFVSGPRPISVINSENVPLPPGTSSNLKTFGTPISELIEFEGEMVPSVVRQCVFVIDKYGLELEGIYRTSGNASTVHSLKDLIDKDPSNIKLILPNPNSITDSDIYAVASLLKLYFSMLPEALLTNEASPKFLEYVKIPEPEIRLKRIHQVVYDLPDGSYWTLRSLIFHLSKVSAKQDINLMNPRNLGIIWGPTLFPKGDFNANDMSYQGKLVEELITHANDIFEAE